MSEGLFDKSVVSIACPSCSEKNARTVGWTKRNSDTECDHCGSIFQLPRHAASHQESEVERTIGGLRSLLRSQAREQPVEPERRRFWRRG